MIRSIWTTIVPKRVGEEIIVAKVSQGSALNRWQAQRIINAIRANISLERIAADIVVMDGDPDQHTRVIGSSPDAEAFVRSIASELAAYKWQLTKLDW